MTTKKRSASAIAEDMTLAREIARAHEFTAALRLGPHNKLYERGFPDYETARAAADRMELQSKFGRKALVYGVSKLGSFPVDAAMIELVNQIKAAG